MSKRPPLVEVEWLDARDWNLNTLTLEQIPVQVKLRLRHSKGDLVYQDDERTILASTEDPPENDEEQREWGDFTCIPTGWVKKITYKARGPRAKKGKAHDAPPTPPTSD